MESTEQKAVTLESLRALATPGVRQPDFISVGRITHSAPSADFSMRIAKDMPA